MSFGAEEQDKKEYNLCILCFLCKVESEYKREEKEGWKFFQKQPEPDITHLHASHSLEGEPTSTRLLLWVVSPSRYNINKRIMPESESSLPPNQPRPPACKRSTDIGHIFKLCEPIFHRTLPLVAFPTILFNSSASSLPTFYSLPNFLFMAWKENNFFPIHPFWFSLARLGWMPPYRHHPCSLFMLYAMPCSVSLCRFSWFNAF